MIFDGIDYEVQHEVPYGGRPERVLVWHAAGSLVATAVIEHDVEQVFITIHGSVDSESTFPYHDYTLPGELARWMIAESN